MLRLSSFQVEVAIEEARRRRWDMNNPPSVSEVVLKRIETETHFSAQKN